MEEIFKILDEIVLLHKYRAASLNDLVSKYASQIEYLVLKLTERTYPNFDKAVLAQSVRALLSRQDDYTPQQAFDDIFTASYNTIVPDMMKTINEYIVANHLTYSNEILSQIVDSIAPVLSNWNSYLLSELADGTVNENGVSFTTDNRYSIITTSLEGITPESVKSTNIYKSMSQAYLNKMVA